MAFTPRSRWLVLTLGALLLVAAVFFLPDQLARAVRARSLQLMEQAAGPQSRIAIGHVGIELLAGDITWRDLRIEHLSDSTDTTWVRTRPVLITGEVDRIAVQGLSIWKLLLAKRLDVRTLAIAGARLELITPASAQEVQQPDTGKDLVRQVRLDSLRVDSSSVQWSSTMADGAEAALQRLTIRASGLRAALPRGDQPFTFTFSSASAELDSLHAGLPPLYDLAISRARLAHPDSVLLLNDITLSSRKGPQDYGQVLPYETDLTTFHSASIGMRGLDLAAWLNSGSLRAGELRISGTDLQDYRDKTMRDAPFKDKPMPARLLRSLPFPVCLDSLVVEQLNVVYFEKDSNTPDYGSVDFTGISAVAHGLCTLHPEEDPELHLVATAKVFGNAPVHFDFRTAVFDSSDHFSVKARVGALPFRVFNAMTNELLLVRATAGTIGGIDYTFEANKNHGQGRVDMEYAGLKLRVAKRDGSQEKNVMGSFLLNQLTRSQNQRSGGNFRHGDFTVERVKEKQVFNYLWRGLRQGMLETVLPEVVKGAQQVVKDAKEVTQEKPEGKS